jgi:cyclopropane fatty-acyl-phospholipid synthase-like methyltransferase
MRLRAAVVAQFRRPQGLWGRAAGWIMASRASNRERNLWTLDLLRIDPRDRVLEIGCGPGLALEACAARLREGIVIGLDHSDTMLQQARRRNRAAIAGNRVALRLGDLRALARLPGRFDKVFSVNLVQFLADRVAAFRALHAVTVPGGLVASTYQPRHADATRDDALRMASDVAREMAQVGFVGIRCEELPLRPVPAICVLGMRPPP